MDTDIFTDDMETTPSGYKNRLLVHRHLFLALLPIH